MYNCEKVRYCRKVREMGIRSERDRNIREYVNDVTGDLLEKLTNRELGDQYRLSEIEALRWLDMLEGKFVELERVALAIAVARGYTLQQCADALGVSRQTIDTKFGKALRPIQQKRKDAEKKFKSIWIEPELNYDGKITWKCVECDISELDYTKGMFDADYKLREQIEKNPENYKAICDRAIKEGVLPPNEIEEIRQLAQQYLECPNKGDKWMIGVSLFRLSAEYRKQRFLEAAEDDYLDEEELAESNLKMSAERHDYLVLWEEFQKEERANGRIPTKKALADRIGMNRSTLSRKINFEMQRLVTSRTFMEKNEYDLRSSRNV